MSTWRQTVLISNSSHFSQSKAPLLIVPMFHYMEQQHCTFCYWSGKASRCAYSQLVFQASLGTAVNCQSLMILEMVVQGMGWEAQCGEDLRHLLHTLQHLPLDPSQAASNVAPLVNLCNTRFAALPVQVPDSGERSRHLHRSLTENDPRAQRHTDEVHPLSGRTRQHQKVESDREAAGSSGTSLAELDVHVGRGTDTDGAHTAARMIDHDALQQSGNAVDHVSTSSIPREAHQSSSLQSTAQGTDRSADGTGFAEGQSSTWNGTTAPDSDSGGAHQEAQRAAVALEEPKQDAGTADDGEVDMVATSSDMLAGPVPSVKVLSEFSESFTGPELDGGVDAVSSKTQPDNAG